MNIKQFKTKLLRGYLSPPLFKLPVRKKQKQMELPEDLKIHYRYIDFYKLLENEISKSHLIVDLNFNQLSQYQYSSWKNPKCSVKVFYPAGYRSLEITDLTPFAWHKISLSYSRMNFYASEYQDNVLKKIGVFSDYSCWENSTCLSSGLDGYFFYENNLIGVLSNTSSFKNAASYLDYTSYQYGIQDDGEITGPYGNHYYAWRHEDRFDIISNANLDLSQGGVKFNYTHYVGMHQVNKDDSYNNPAKWKYYTTVSLGATYSNYFYVSSPTNGIYYDEFSKKYLFQLCLANNEQDIAINTLNIEEKEGLL